MVEKLESNNSVKEKYNKSELNEIEREILLDRTKKEFIRPLTDFGLTEPEIKKIINGILTEIVVKKEDHEYKQVIIKKETVGEYVLAFMYLSKFTTKSIFESINECFQIKRIYHYLLEILFKSDICLHSDIKFGEHDIIIMANEILKKYNLEVSFFDYKWSKDSTHPSFVIELSDGNNKKIRKFHYSDERLSSLTELIAAINTLLKPYNLFFADARSGNDDYTFVLFQINQYDDLKSKYTDFPLFFEPYAEPKYLLLNLYNEWKNILLKPSQTFKELRYSVQERTLPYSLVLLTIAGLVAAALSRFTSLEETMQMALNQKDDFLFFDPILSIGFVFFFGITSWIGARILGHNAEITKWLPIFISASAPIISLMNIPFFGTIIVLYGIFIIYRLVSILTYFNTKKAISIILFCYIWYIIIYIIELNIISIK